MSFVQPLGIAEQDVAEFCRRWGIVEFSLFGSALREDFGPDSDVDVLVAFAPESPRSLSDLVEMEKELSAVSGRKVDLVPRQCLANPFRRYEILRTRKVLYAG
jgi:uncharacterized protein